jgi:beta-lactamase superfamily II metal-dependent hydrolase
MPDFFEIDFLDVESSKSGDAIPIRYQLDDLIRIHVVDGGFQDTGDKVVEHIKTHYNNSKIVHSIVVSHPDGDHAGGLRKILEEFTVGEI